MKQSFQIVAINFKIIRFMCPTTASLSGAQQTKTKIELAFHVNGYSNVYAYRIQTPYLLAKARYITSIEAVKMKILNKLFVIV